MTPGRRPLCLAAGDQLAPFEGVEGGAAAPIHQPPLQVPREVEEYILAAGLYRATSDE